MDEGKEKLEKEIQEHKARLAKILESLTDIEDNVGKPSASKQHALRVAQAMRRETRACDAALSIDAVNVAL
jgi:wobble nucleotide-excising tRNase